MERGKETKYNPGSPVLRKLTSNPMRQYFRNPESYHGSINLLRQRSAYELTVKLTQCYCPRQKNSTIGHLFNKLKQPMCKFSWRASSCGRVNNDRPLQEEEAEVAHSCCSAAKPQRCWTLTWRQWFSSSLLSKTNVGFV